MIVIGIIYLILGFILAVIVVLDEPHVSLWEKVKYFLMFWLGYGPILLFGILKKLFENSKLEKRFNRYAASYKVWKTNRDPVLRDLNRIKNKRLNKKV